MTEKTIEEKMTKIDGWVVIYPSSCNGVVRDLGFVYPENGNSNFVHFDMTGRPYGTYMPKKVCARLVAMRNRFLKEMQALDKMI